MPYNYEDQHNYYLRNKEKKIKTSKEQYSKKQKKCICGGGRETKDHFKSHKHILFNFQIQATGVLRERHRDIKHCNLYRVLMDEPNHIAYDTDHIMPNYSKLLNYKTMSQYRKNN